MNKQLEEAYEEIANIMRDIKSLGCYLTDDILEEIKHKRLPPHVDFINHEDIMKYIQKLNDEVDKIKLKINK